MCRGITLEENVLIGITPCLSAVWLVGLMWCGQIGVNKSRED